MVECVSVNAGTATANVTNKGALKLKMELIAHMTARTMQAELLVSLVTGFAPRPFCNSEKSSKRKMLRHNA